MIQAAPGIVANDFFRGLPVGCRAGCLRLLSVESGTAHGIQHIDGAVFALYKGSAGRQVYIYLTHARYGLDGFGYGCLAMRAVHAFDYVFFSHLIGC